MVNFQSMERYSFQDLNRIMALLRQPGGCPWDREQTHESIRRNMLEEAYEAVEAIDEKDPGHLKEELGDVLLQVVFHARMAEEEGLFTLDDVVDGICKKLVYRHPHVFGTVDARDSGQALNTWDAQKREEKGQRTATDAMNGVARSLPALMRAEKIQGKAAKAGFDWPDAGPALDKLSEEVEELRRAAREGSNTREELGDVLYQIMIHCEIEKEQGNFTIDDVVNGICEKMVHRHPRLFGGEMEKDLTWEEIKRREKEARAARKNR